MIDYVRWAAFRVYHQFPLQSLPDITSCLALLGSQYHAVVTPLYSMLKQHLTTCSLPNKICWAHSEAFTYSIPTSISNSEPFLQLIPICRFLRQLRPPLESLPTSLNWLDPPIHAILVLINKLCSWHCNCLSACVLSTHSPIPLHMCMQMHEHTHTSLF